MYIKIYIYIFSFFFLSKLLKWISHSNTAPITDELVGMPYCILKFLKIPQISKTGMPFLKFLYTSKMMNLCNRCLTSGCTTCEYK